MKNFVKQFIGDESSSKGIPDAPDPKPIELTPEQQRYLAARLTSMVAADRDNLTSPGMSKGNNLLSYRVNEIFKKLFDVTKVSNQVALAFREVIGSISEGTEPDEANVATVLNAMKRVASAEFKAWYKENIGVAKRVEKTIGRGKNKKSLDYVQYKTGAPLKDIDLNALKKFYHYHFGYPVRTKREDPAVGGERTVQSPHPLAHPAQQGGLSRTARALGI